MKKDSWKIYLGDIPYNEKEMFWVSFESDPRLSRTKANIYGRCLPCIQNLYEQLNAGKSSIDMGNAYNCWKITAVVENIDHCLSLLFEFEKRYAYGHVYGKIGSGRVNSTTKVVVFHTDDESERDRLAFALQRCIELMTLNAKIFISRGCDTLHKPILGEWQMWQPTTPICFPEKIPEHIEKIRKIIKTGRM